MANKHNFTFHIDMEELERLTPLLRELSEKVKEIAQRADPLPEDEIDLIQELNQR